MKKTDKFISVLREAGFTDEVMQEIINNNKIAREMLNAIKYELTASKMILEFAVDYTRDLSQITGKNNRGVHCFVPKDEIKAPKNIITKVFYFKNSEQIEGKMEKESYRPANAYELVVFGKKNPKAHRTFPIVALNSTWHDDLGDSVLFLCDNSSKSGEYRYFCSPPAPMTYPEGYCFLGVHM